MPSLNLRGKQEISTIAGGLVSIVVASIVLAFALIKLDVLLNKYNPNVLTNIVHQSSGTNNKYDTANQNFQLAFGLLGQRDGVARDDEFYLKWFARVREVQDGVKS